MKSEQKKQLCSYIDKEDYEMLKIEAEQEDISMSKFVYKILQEHFK